MYWERTDPVNGASSVEIWWQIPSDVEAGIYRITYESAFKDPADSTVKPFSGQCNEFNVA